jgi:hypothetical protein
VLLVLVATLVSRRMRPDSEAGVVSCPPGGRGTQLAAMLLWDNAGGSMAPAPEVRRLRPKDLTALTEPADAERCRHLLAALPDTLRPGVLSAHQVGLFQAGDLFIVVVVSHHSPAELRGISRGDPAPERPGETRIYGRDYRLLATYPN